MDKDLIKIDVLKIKIKDLISRKIVEILVDKKLPFKQIQDMAVDITDTLNMVKTKDDIIKFVKELPNFYPYLTSIAQAMNVELSEIKQQQVIGRLESYIKNSPAKI